MVFPLSQSRPGLGRDFGRKMSVREVSDICQGPILDFIGDQDLDHLPSGPEGNILQPGSRRAAGIRPSLPLPGIARGLLPPWQPNRRSEWPSWAWVSGPSSSRSNQAYPGAEVSAICRRSRKDLDECGDRWKIARRYTDFAEVLADPEVDAVHINSPIQDHAWQSIAALQAGKHVACTVPMATTVEECGRIVAAQRAGRARST